MEARQGRDRRTQAGGLDAQHDSPAGQAPGSAR
jgi:hypothetical protein